MYDYWPTEWNTISAITVGIIFIVNAICLAISIGRNKKLKNRIYEKRVNKDV